MPTSTKQVSAKNVRSMVNQLETAAGRIEKEFERQLKALDRARDAMKSEAKKQLDAIRREQRGFLTRIRQSSRPSTGSSTRRSSSRRTTARRSPARRSRTRARTRTRAA